MQPDADRAGGSPDAIGAARHAIGQARLQHSRGVEAASCAGPLLVLPEAPIDKAIDLILGDILPAMFSGGWSPRDFAEIGRRRLEDADAVAYLLDAVAAVTDSYPDALVDPRWRGQVDGYGARARWDRGRPHLAQWAVAHRLSRYSALVLVIEVLGVLDALGRLDQVLPPPGTAATTQATHPIDAAQEKVLGKVRALLAKAESTEFVDEAEALSAKAQELMSRYALDRALLDHRRGVRQEASLSRVWLDSPYLTPKALLVDAVARANRCRTMLSAELGFVTVIGDELDLRLVELLATSLLVQATRAMVAAGAQVSRHGTSRTRSYRQSFLVAYAVRIGERLRVANESEATADEGALLPVLSARSRAVEELIARQFPNIVSRTVSTSNAAGHHAGRAAADQAQLDVRDALNQAG